MREQTLRTTNMKKLIGMGIGAIIVLGIAMGILLKLPTSSLILDVNPSIELKTNRLKEVVGIKPLNEDAKKLLEGFKLEDRDIEDVVEDLIDRMILTGHIAGGKDNLVMITVDDNNASKDMVDKVNLAISAYLENRQLEAAILNQTIDMDDDDLKVAKEKGTSPGKLKIIQRIMDNDKDLSYGDLVSISLKDLLSTAKTLEIDPEELFDSYVGILGKNNFKDDDDDKDKAMPTAIIEVESVGKPTKDDNKKANKKENRISSEEAKSIAGKLANGKIKEFELDRDDGRLIYEIEIDAYTGKVLKHEIDDDDHHKRVKKTDNRISSEKAKSIALKLANGKITDFELDEDDGRLIYEIEIETKDKEHEIEIDAYTGKVLEHEIDD